MSDDIDVSGMLFNAVRVFSSTEETRYYLNGVHIEPHPEKGALLVATDGNRLIVALDSDAKCDRDVIVSVDKNMSVALGRIGADARIRISADGVVTIPGYFQSAGSVLIDAIYPDWKRVVDSVRKEIAKGVVAACSVNAHYVAGFEKVAIRLMPDKKGHVAVRLIPTGEGDPALVLFPDFPSAFGLQMPMRAPVEHGLPAWMKPVLSPPKMPDASTTPKRKAERRKVAAKKKNAKAPSARLAAKRKTKSAARRRAA